MIVGGMVVKSWSRTQRGRSLSSTEAEYDAIVTGAAEALTVQALAEEMGWKMSVKVEVLMAPRIGTRPEDRDQEEQCLTKPKDFKCFEALLRRVGARPRSATTQKR